MQLNRQRVRVRDNVSVRKRVRVREAVCVSDCVCDWELGEGLCVFACSQPK